MLKMQVQMQTQMQVNEIVFIPYVCIFICICVCVARVNQAFMLGGSFVIHATGFSFGIKELYYSFPGIVI